MVNFKLIRSKQRLNSNRHSLLISRVSLYKKKRIKQVSHINLNSAGRTINGSVVCRTKGSRNKFFIRFLYIKNRTFVSAVPAKLIRIEFDPRRSSILGGFYLSNNICFYSLLTDGLNLGNLVFVYTYSVHLFDSKINLPVVICNGDSSELFTLSVGITIHSLDKFPNADKSYITSAGCFGLFLQKFKFSFVGLVKLPSGRINVFSLHCFATKGVLCNKDYRRQQIGQAGRNSRIGKKPVVRGVARNPVDHPHGGGEGKKSPPSCKRTAWGKMLS